MGTRLALFRWYNEWISWHQPQLSYHHHLLSSKSLFIVVYGAVGTVTIRPSPHLQCGANPSQLQRQNGGECGTRTHRWLLAKHPCAPAHSPNPNLGCIFRRGGTDGKHGANSESRTRDIELGRIALYQLSYVRKNLVVHLRRIELRFTG